MKYSDILEELKKNLNTKFPDGFNYTQKLAEILGLHPKTISRKLRGDIQFSLSETITISRIFNISLDNLYLFNSLSSKHPMEMYISDFSNKEEYEKITYETLDTFLLASTSPTSKYLVATNYFPDFVYHKYLHIGKFFTISWLYFNKGIRYTPAYSKLNLPPENEDIYKRYCKYIFSMKSSVYVLTRNMIKNVTDRILFFHQLNLISKEEIKGLINEYYKLLDDFEKICFTGKASETGNNVSIYISDFSFESNITVVDSDKIKLAIIYTFFFNPIFSKNLSTFEIMKTWFTSIIRSSTLVSLSGEISRQTFFMKQREDLHNFYNIL